MQTTLKHIVDRQQIQKKERVQSNTEMSKLQINLKYFEAVLSKSRKQKRPQTTFLPVRSSLSVSQNRQLFTASIRKPGKYGPFDMKTNIRSPSSSEGLRTVRCTSFNKSRPLSSPKLQECKFQVLNKRCFKKIIEQESKPSNKIDFQQILSHDMKGGKREGENNLKKDSYQRFHSKKLCSIKNKKKIIVKEMPEEEANRSLSSSLRISILSLKTE